jgi:AmiR/NasT family two-component response regulator
MRNDGSCSDGQVTAPWSQALADVAMIGILQQRSAHRVLLVAEQSQSALNTRIVIERAKGVLARTRPD